MASGTAIARDTNPEPRAERPRPRMTPSGTRGRQRGRGPGGPSLLTRYVIREHIGPLIFALSSLTLFLLLNQVAKQFGNLVGKGLSWGVIGELFVLSLPFIVAMTLPMAVLVAVLYAFSRLAAENEVTALRASGVSVVRLVRPVMFAGLVLAVIMLLFNDQVLSRSNHALRVLQTAIARKKPTFALREQVINEVVPGRLFLRAGHIDPATNKLREIFIYNFEDPTRRKTVYADSGQMGLTSDETTLQLTLHHGWVLEVNRQDPASLQRLFFRTDQVRVRGVANKFEGAQQDNYKGEREMTMCEMNQQYQAGYQSLASARGDLERMLVNATRYLTSGTRPAAAPLERTTPPPQALTSGRVYCDLISTLFGGARSAGAAEPGAFLLQGLQGLKDVQRPGGTIAQRYAPPPAAVFLTVPQIEIARSRILDARSTLSRYEVEIQKKFALAAACVVFVLFGAPIALRFPRGGVGLVIGVSLVSFSLYYVCLIAGETLADKLILNPFWAMWMANAIFASLGALLLVRVQRHGATARGGDAGEMWEALRAAVRRRLAPAAREGRRSR